MSAVPRHVPPLSGVGAGYLFYDPRESPRRVAPAVVRMLAREVAYRVVLAAALLVVLEVGVYTLKEATQ